MLRTHKDVDIRRESCLEIGCLNVKYRQEMHLDTTSTFNGLKGISPSLSSLDASISHLSPNLMNTFPLPLFSSTPSPTNATAMNMAQLQSLDYRYFDSATGVYVTDTKVQPAYIEKRNFYQTKEKSKFDENFNIQHMEPHSISEAMLVRNQPENEISQSLKMLAMLASCKQGNDSTYHDKNSLVDDVMQDFYSNGYETDESSTYPHGNGSTETSSNLCQYYKTNNNHNNGVESNLNYNVINFGIRNGCTPNTIFNNNNPAIFNPQYLNQNSLHFPTPLPIFGGVITSQAAKQHIATVAAAAANIEYNSQNIKKPQKRSGCTKFDKVAAVKHCVFCENNHEPDAVVKSHAVRDSLGRVLCPKLRTYICPICKASGDEAHTVKYCPQKPIITMEDAVKAESLRLSKNSYYRYGTKA